MALAMGRGLELVEPCFVEWLQVLLQRLGQLVDHYYLNLQVTCRLIEL